MAWKLKDMDNKEAYQIAALLAQLGKRGTREGDANDRFLSYQLENAQVGIQQELMKEAQEKQKKGLAGAMGGGIGKVLGGAAGFALGGPVGAGIGAGLGNAGGQAIGGGTIGDPMSVVSALGSGYTMGKGMQSPAMPQMQTQAPQMIAAPTMSTQATPQPTITNPLPQVTGPVGNNTVLMPQQQSPVMQPMAPQPQNAMNQFMGFMGNAAQQMAPAQNNLLPRPTGGYNYYPNGQPNAWQSPIYNVPPGMQPTGNGYGY